MATPTSTTRTRLRARAGATAVVAALVATAGASRAAPLLVYEPFAYDADTVLDEAPATGLGLTGSYVALGSLEAQKLVVGDPGLDYGSLIGAPAASGGRLRDVQGVTAGGATVEVEPNVTVAPGHAIFWSALFTFDDTGNANRLANITFEDDASGDSLFFGEPGVGVGGLRVAADTTATGGLVASGSDGAFTNGDTLLLIGRYVNGDAAGGDLLDLVGYDTATASTLPASFDPMDPNAAFAYGLSDLDIDLAQITSITFTIRANDNNFIDELRIGTTYASVVPEPGTAWLMALGLAGAGTLGRAWAGRR